MKRLLLAAVVSLVFFSCKKENEAEAKVAAVPVQEVKIERFDKLYFEGGPQALPKLRQQFPFFFPEGTPDTVWIERMNDPFLKKLHAEVEKKYASVGVLEGDIELLIKHIKYYYPKVKQPRVITLVSDDLEVKAVYANDLMVIPLSLYLGADNYLYEGLDRYLVQQFEPSQILPDLVTSFTAGKVAPPKDRTLLSMMVYHGKELYIKDKLIPEVSDFDKIGYTKEQDAWAHANEAEVWRYFVDNNLLFDNDPKLAGRFINPAPFSKFYLEIDKDSPGRIGQWTGWQIVRSYMENHPEVTLEQLLKMDAKMIFDNSKYKPKK
jgi:gliding motility-associated lipoprotein GldB